MTGLDPREVINEVESLLNAMPKPEHVCKCGKTFAEHHRLGKRNIWVRPDCTGFEQGDD